MIPARVLDSYSSFHMSLIPYTDGVFMEKNYLKIIVLQKHLYNSI